MRSIVFEQFLYGLIGGAFVPLHLGPQGVGGIVIGFLDCQVNQTFIRAVFQRRDGDWHLNGGPDRALALIAHSNGVIAG